MRPGCSGDGILAYVDSPAPTDRPSAAGTRRPRDLAISLLVLLVPVLVLVGGYQLVSGRTQPVTVDQTPAILAARGAGFEVAEPTGLGPDWVPVSGVFRTVDGGATLRLGYLTPAGEGVQLVQSTVAAARLLTEELTEDAAPAGTVEVDGIAWQRYPGRSGETALVLREAEHTLLVVGPAAESELRRLAASLS
jgi:hypothetical protein